MDGNAVCSALADSKGGWHCLPAAALTEGLHVAVAVATGPGGHASTPSEGVAFTVSSKLPAKPVILSPEAKALLNEARPVFHGKAGAGLRVELRVGGALLCAVVTNDAGQWHCIAALGLRDGRHQAEARSRDEAGHASEPAKLRFRIDTQAPPAPAFNPPNGRLRPSLFDGTAEPGTLVRVSVDGADACSSTVAKDGSWSCTAALAGGKHRATAVAIDEAGNESPEIERRFKVIQGEKMGGGGSGCSAGSGGATLGWGLPLLGVFLLLRRRPADGGTQATSLPPPAARSRS